MSLVSAEVGADETALFLAVGASQDLSFHVHRTPTPVLIRHTSVSFIARQRDVVGKAATTERDFAGGAEKTGGRGGFGAEETQFAGLRVVFRGFMGRNRQWTE